MLDSINGINYRDMIDYGVRNLNKHCKTVNQLNVFPVPDGDTGTNMVTTIKKGLFSVEETQDSLSVVAKRFASSIVFAARGNSGVIVSQFLKGLSESFFGVEEADALLFIKGLENGTRSAYNAVANPVEGTILTVVKDATDVVKSKITKDNSIDDVIDLFIKSAKTSLEKTPDLLPELKAAGVVDSGGAGIVYLFEGMKKYLDGEKIEVIEIEEQEKQVDYSAFNMNSVFDYGYCTELLLQLLNSKEVFNYENFKKELNELGDSVVTSFEGDKVRVHIHTNFPEEIFAFCHKYGEFLSLKIENMTVQHTETVKNILCSTQKSDSEFSVVAVAYDHSLQKLFIDMGADVVIYSEDTVTTKDYIDAFENVSTDKILVFPNSSDSILTAIQAKNIYKKAAVTVINSRGIAECYSSLPIIDFDEKNVELVVDEITETINQMYIISVAHRNKSICYAGKNISENEFYAFSGREIITIGRNIDDTVIKTIEKTLKKYNKDIITIFHTENFSQKQIENIIDSIEEHGICVDVFSVSTEKLACDLIISFE